jgi:hypothetical protein
MQANEMQMKCKQGSKVELTRLETLEPLDLTLPVQRAFRTPWRAAHPTLLHLQTQAQAQKGWMQKDWMQKGWMQRNLGRRRRLLRQKRQKRHREAVLKRRRWTTRMQQ